LNYIKRVNELEITVLNPDDKGCINPEDLKSKIKKNTRLIIITHCSNVTGTIQPIKEIAKIARDHGVYMIVDSAQSTGRISINVTDINTDAIVFSSHKGLMGPSGIGFCDTWERFQSTTSVFRRYRFQIGTRFFSLKKCLIG
jgi:selenocysteine lyase/cysteine desulfurase